ncbi:MAG: dienelactone hydrolase family protein [Longimicrobiales bacterium]
MDDQGQMLRKLIRLAPPSKVSPRRLELIEEQRYTRTLVEYEGLEGDPIRAYLFQPSTAPPVGGVVAFHQHAGEFHLGKSEVAGLEGDALQAFGPVLASRGVVVLAPDAISFEDRRAREEGTEPTEGDWLQHYNAMAYRLVSGDVLMRKCLDDAQRALSVLEATDQLAGSRLGVMGHSYGGTTALYHAAVDARCSFACVSGSACSFEARTQAGTGINMFELVPGLTNHLDTHDLMRAIAPRDLLVVSATRDPYSADADRVVERSGVEDVTQVRVEGDHALDQHRFDAIVNWVVDRCHMSGS